MKLRVLLLLAFMLTAAAGRGQVYVAVGDSLAFGYQEAKFYNMLLTFSYDPAKFNTGFVDQIDTFVKTAVPTWVTANFGCPGETTVTAINGGCPFHNTTVTFPLHQNYPGSMPQMQAALNYTQAHLGQVWLVTVTLGANDLLNFIANCNGSLTCMQQGLPALSSTVSANVAGMIQVFKAAAPGAVVVWTNVPDPYQFSDPALVPLFASFNSQVASAAQGAGAKVADWFTLEQGVTDPGAFCTLTFVCTAPLYDIHPTDFGYGVLAMSTVQAIFNP